MPEARDPKYLIILITGTIREAAKGFNSQIVMEMVHEYSVSRNKKNKLSVSKGTNYLGHHQKK